MRVIRLNELDDHFLDRDQLAFGEAEAIERSTSPKVEIESPSARTGGRWRLCSRGWIGCIYVSDTLQVRIAPKLPSSNPLELLEWAGRLEGIGAFRTIVDADSVEESLRQASMLLLAAVQRRIAKGLHRTYVSSIERAPISYGRLHVRETVALMARGRALLQSERRYLSADIEDNTLLLCAIEVVARSGALSDRATELVRTIHELGKHVSSRLFRADECIGRSYSPVNRDYRAMHQLCALILTGVGPGTGTGGAATPAIGIHMPDAFERAVARALHQRVLEPFSLATWHKLGFGPSAVVFEPDFIVFGKTGAPIAVLDAKYKDPNKVVSEDVQQVVAYSTALGCNEAFLVYPAKRTKPMDLQVGAVRVRSATFDISRPLDESSASLGAMLDGF